MTRDNYSKVNSILLTETGLLSKSSSDLKVYLAINSIRTVGELLNFVDNSMENSGYLYYDALVELRGLADLLRQKYFDTPFVMDIYFDQSIKYLSFDELPFSIDLYGVKALNGQKKNIYALINRLGFNDKERSLILDVTEDYLKGRLLIDLLSDTYDKFIVDTESDEDKEVLCNKILIILKYYLIKYRHDRESDFSKKVEASIYEFNDLLLRKYTLDMTKSKLKNESKLDNGGRK